jgi:DNA-binding NtrC family response regulator
LGHDVSALIGQSQPMRRLRASIRDASSCSDPVLITGETGTGKELVARSIHQRSHRRALPFVDVGCAFLAETRRGPASRVDAEADSAIGGDAWTDLFMAARTGTLFLDEIRDLSVPLQSSFLDSLKASQQLDVRCIASTNVRTQAPRGELSGTFHAAMNSLSIVVPPLRAHPEDIPVMVGHFLDTRTGPLGRPTRRYMTPEALALLTSYPWPGNVRELENVVERIVVTTDSMVIDAALARWALTPKRLPVSASSF